MLADVHSPWDHKVVAGWTPSIPLSRHAPTPLASEAVSHQTQMSVLRPAGRFSAYYRCLPLNSLSLRNGLSLQYWSSKINSIKSSWESATSPNAPDFASKQDIFSWLQKNRDSLLAVGSNTRVSETDEVDLVAACTITSRTTASILWYINCFW